MVESRIELGLRQLRQVESMPLPSVIEELSGIAPDLARMVVEFCYGDVFARPGLQARHRQLAALGALTVLGNAQSQLRFHIAGALNVGCSPTEIVETLIHLVVYAGFPASLNALFLAREVFFEKGIDLSNIGKRHDENRETDRYAKGWAALSQIDGEAGVRVIESLRQIAPDLGRFVVQFAFGDIYSRQGLDLLSREIVTVSALAAMGTAVPQLKVHIHGLLNVGGSQEQLIETLIQVAVYAGFPAAINGVQAAQQVLEERANGHTRV